MYMNRVARFGKVSYEQFKRDWLNIFGHKYKDLNEDAIDKDVHDIYDSIQLPKRGTSKSAGHDFVSPLNLELQPNETIMIPTGINCKMCDDIVLMIFPRSGLGAKFRFVPCNLVGVIDADYIYSDNEGHIFMKMVNDGDKVLSLEKGKAFCQGILMHYFLTKDDEVTSKRNGGMGSTDK